MTIFVATLLVAAVLTDVMSLVLAVRRVLKGSGPSGVPILSLFAYYFLTEWMNQSFIFGTPLWAMVAFTVFHLLCQYLIPSAVRLGLKRK